MLALGSWVNKKNTIHMRADYFNTLKKHRVGRDEWEAKEREAAYALSRSIAYLPLKWYDSSQSGTYLATSASGAGGDVDPAGSCLSCPARGDGPVLRDGMRILLHSCHVIGEITTSSAVSPLTPATIYNSNCFLALVLDTKTNNAQCLSEHVFTNTSAGLSAHPLKNLYHEPRFRVLKSKAWELYPVTLIGIIEEVLTLGLTTSTLSMCRAIQFDWLVEGLDIPVHFSADAADVTSVIDNSLHMIAYCNGVWYLPNIRYNCRVRYSD